MGGLDQCGSQGVDSRYNTELICSKVNSIRDVFSSRILRGGSCSCLDFTELFVPGEAGFYLDPPYYKAGPEVYQLYFRHEDHVRLASMLKEESRPWLLSYDCHPAILDLYAGWSRIEEVSVSYSMDRPVKNVELLISAR
jgi:DNA adenine methylase